MKGSDGGITQRQRRGAGAPLSASAVSHDHRRQFIHLLAELAEKL
jgi:hypothetical protein